MISQTVTGQDLSTNRVYENPKTSVSLPILFTYFRSSCAWRVRIALEYKQIKYKSIPMQLMRNEQLSPEFLKINPLGQVPALVINGNTILQSIAIMEYLEEIYPTRPLLPKDPLKKAKVREISEMIASGIQPLQNFAVLHKLSINDGKKLEWAQFWIHRGLSALDAVLASSSGKYCVGDDITMADCCLVPQVANALRFKLDINQFPTCKRIAQDLGELPEFKLAHASAQQDCPPEMYSKI